MQRKQLLSSVVIGVLLLACGIGATAQVPRPMNLRGVIDASGVWNVRGDWSITIRESGKADFATAVNMQHSDYFLMQTTVNGVSNDNPAGLGAHTHHISLLDADVTPVAGGFQISGPATITVNGNAAPVSPSQVTITVTGGALIPYSNISIVFAKPGSNHFGTDPLTGVVRSTRRLDDY